VKTTKTQEQRTQEQRTQVAKTQLCEGKTNNKSSENIRLINTCAHSKIEFFSHTGSILHRFYR